MRSDVNIHHVNIRPSIHIKPITLTEIFVGRSYHFFGIVSYPCDNMETSLTQIVTIKWAINFWNRTVARNRLKISVYLEKKT